MQFLKKSLRPSPTDLPIYLMNCKIFRVLRATTGYAGSANDLGLSREKIFPTYLGKG